jgi:hypothetical protein
MQKQWAVVCFCQVVKELKRSEYKPRMAVLVGASASAPLGCALC